MFMYLMSSYGIQMSSDCGYVYTSPNPFIQSQYTELDIGWVRHERQGDEKRKKRKRKKKEKRHR